MNHRKENLKRFRYLFKLRNEHYEYRRQCRKLLRELRGFRQTRSERLKSEEAFRSAKTALSIWNSIAHMGGMR